MPSAPICHGRGCDRRPAGRVQVVTNEPGFEGSAPGDVVCTVPACTGCADQVRAEVKELCRGAPVAVCASEGPLLRTLEQ